MPEIAGATAAPLVLSRRAEALPTGPDASRRAGRTREAALAFVALCAAGAIAQGPAAAEETYPPAFACLGQEGPLEVLRGPHYDEIEPDTAARKKFDARAASFEYPETISHSMVSLGEKGGSGADDMCWAGGYFTASTSWHDLDISWRESKEGYDDTEADRGEMNNTTSMTSYEDRMTWSGVHVYNMHDALRTNNTFNNWTVKHVWFDYIRDDCIENDSAYSGTVYDSLFDGCYTGFSSQADEEGQGEGQRITMDKVLIRMEPMPYPYKWDEKDDPVIYLDGYEGIPFGHGSIFKLEEGFMPEFEITDSVFLQEFDAEEDLFPPKDKVTKCENNTIIWLDGPETAPTHLLDAFPDCFRLITDRMHGLNVWRTAVADWHARHPKVGANRKPLSPGSYSWPRFGSSPIFTPAPEEEEPTAEGGEEEEVPTVRERGPKHDKDKGKAHGRLSRLGG